jgi:hypothetical protein
LKGAAVFLNKYLLRLTVYDQNSLGRNRISQTDNEIIVSGKYNPTISIQLLNPIKSIRSQRENDEQSLCGLPVTTLVYHPRYATRALYGMWINSQVTNSTDSIHN